MVYLDTSFLAPLFLPEEMSRKAAACVQGLPANQLAVSNWTMVEFSSLLARKVRTRELSADGAALADARFEAAVGDSFVVVFPGVDDFAAARRYVQRLETGLRAPDALHLAIAANRKVEAIYSFDKAMIRAGRLLGLPIRDGTGAD